MTAYRTTSVRLSGTIQGHIWMPALLCEKRFDVSIGAGPFQKEWTSLRDLLCDITNDGGFRTCSITRLLLEVKRTKPSILPHSLSTRVRCLQFDVDNAPAAIADLFAAEQYLDGEDED
jgi:hypothetical protein